MTATCTYVSVSPSDLPALLTRMSIFPNNSLALPVADLVSSGSERSTGNTLGTSNYGPIPYFHTTHTIRCELCTLHFQDGLDCSSPPPASPCSLLRGSLWHPFWTTGSTSPHQLYTPRRGGGRGVSKHDIPTHLLPYWHSQTILST